MSFPIFDSVAEAPTSTKGFRVVFSSVILSEIRHWIKTTAKAEYIKPCYKLTPYMYHSIRSGFYKGHWTHTPEEDQLAIAEHRYDLLPPTILTELRVVNAVK